MTNPSSEDNAQSRAKSQEADFLHLEIIKTRADFLRAAKRGTSWGAKGIFLQGYDRGDGSAPRVGFTCSKKVGNAVQRNRAKRRLREVARIILPAIGKAGWDYVMIGKAEVTASRDFIALQGDLEYALEKVHGAK